MKMSIRIELYLYPCLKWIKTLENENGLKQDIFQPYQSIQDWFSSLVQFSLYSKSWKDEMSHQRPLCLTFKALPQETETLTIPSHAVMDSVLSAYYLFDISFTSTSKLTHILLPIKHSLHFTQLIWKWSGCWFLQIILFPCLKLNQIHENLNGSNDTFFSILVKSRLVFIAGSIQSVLKILKRPAVPSETSISNVLSFAAWNRLWRSQFWSSLTIRVYPPHWFISFCIFKALPLKNRLQHSQFQSSSPLTLSHNFPPLTDSYPWMALQYCAAVIFCSMCWISLSHIIFNSLLTQISAGSTNSDSRTPREFAVFHRADILSQSKHCTVGLKRAPNLSIYIVHIKSSSVDSKSESAQRIAALTGFAEHKVSECSMVR